MEVAFVSLNGWGSLALWTENEGTGGDWGTALPVTLASVYWENAVAAEHVLPLLKGPEESCLLVGGTAGHG